ncbi:alpha/beta hydrolase [Hoyosella sp. YIM 151337]|uniref:alpha/beta hydrolase n=1 Tax=Hoyosella sp. YIM 151337 TaxID=2992742 RepID=UPI00223655FF|nr:alpha/beta hydrolase [Hoyosella sp. YIM 151337]MCW4355201.1 alpha/beta hydrolase [Hoyosella sp. YIM 151337]
MSTTADRNAVGGTGLSAAERVQRMAFTVLGRLPRSLLRRLVPRVINSDGDVMAPEVAVLMRLSAAGPDLSDGAVAEARVFMETDARTYADTAPGVSRQDYTLPTGIAATLFTPPHAGDGLVLFFHGGGFALGNVAAYDGPVCTIATAARVRILSVEYRLAPEHPFPAPIEDAIAAWRFALDSATEWNVDPARIALLGDSAGATIAAVLANELRAESVRPALQVLMYPSTDFDGSHGSRTEFADSPALTAKQISWFAELYVPDPEQRSNPRVSPLRTRDLTGAPPTLITVAGFDPLRDEAIAYAKRLRDAGVPVRLLREGDLVHGYISMTLISPAARAAVNRVSRVLADTVGF